MTSIGRRIRTTLTTALVMRGPQNFLGGAGFSRLIRLSPRGLRRNVALRLLALSPHYYFGPAEAEDRRMTASRERLIADIVAPHIDGASVVIDYGCGPGYAARAAALRAASVVAVDISDGVLAAAAVLNGAPNIRYQHASEALPRADLAYSFAVAQHIADDALGPVLNRLFAALKPGGLLILHVVIDGEGWRTEQEWRDDASTAGRLKLKLGLHCFSRDRAGVERLVTGSGFAIEAIERAGERSTADSDIAGQHLVYARKR